MRYIIEDFFTGATLYTFETEGEFLGFVETNIDLYLPDIARLKDGTRVFFREVR